jgi:hypothetical protein
MEPDMKHALIAVLLLFTWGCTTTEVADNAEAASAMLALQQDYEQVRDELTRELDSLPTETGLMLLDLQQSADAYVEKLKTAWSAGLTADQLDALYLEGRSLYLRGEALLLPLTDTLPPRTWALLGRFAQQAQAVDDLYLRIKSGDPQTRELIRAGLALATLALRVGMMAL